jgi:hypothetical protein
LGSTTEFAGLIIDGSPLSPSVGIGIGNLGDDCNVVPACKTYGLVGVITGNGQTVTAAVETTAGVGSCAVGFGDGDATVQVLNVCQGNSCVGFGTFTTGTPETITIAANSGTAAFNSVTLNVGDSLLLCVRGDLSGSSQFVTLIVGGTALTPPIGNIGSDCDTVPACETYSLAGIVTTNGQTVSVEITSSSEVGSTCEFNDATLSVLKLNQCPDANIARCPKNSYAINTDVAGTLCVTFGSGTQFAPNLADSVVASTNIVVTSGDGSQAALASQYTAGSPYTCLLATDARGNLIKLFCEGAVDTFGFGACGCVEFGNLPSKKRGASISGSAVGVGTFVAVANAGGDPHLEGLFGIEFDVFGKPNANYSLLVTPAFQVNMQVAQFGPELRYMTRMSVLYRGKSISFGPMAVKLRKDELVKHFAALGANVTIDGWLMTIDLCARHQLVFKSMHALDGSKINFLDVEVRVPGCHNSYGGLLGQTYQCKYATDQFQWSRDKEESFELPTLETPSGSYTSVADCAHEDEYDGEPIHGATQSTDGGIEMG